MAAGAAGAVVVAVAALGRSIEAIADKILLPAGSHLDWWAAEPVETLAVPALPVPILSVVPVASMVPGTVHRWRNTETDSASSSTRRGSRRAKATMITILKVMTL